MNETFNAATPHPVTPITGIPYLEAMLHCAEIGSVRSLKEMLEELEQQGSISEEFSKIASFCGRASEFEECHGVGSLLDLSHPSVAVLIDNVISREQLRNIQQRQDKIAAEPSHAKLAEALKSEGRGLA